MKLLKTTILILTILMVGCQKEDGIVLTTKGLEIGINSKGQLTMLKNPGNDKDHLYQKEGSNGLMAIRVHGELENPASMKVGESGERFTLTYPKNNVEAVVKATQKEGYVTFELISITHADKIELALWGPYRTDIKETIGETVGVVRNKDFAFGIQALNKRTLGGFPSTEDDSTPSYDIFGTTSLIDVSDSLKILYRGNTALPRDYGSSIQAYARNRDNPRVVSAMGHGKYVSPSFKDEGIVGSKIALFGCSPNEVLATLGAIEVTEGLPHPVLEGKWAKESPAATSAYLIQEFGVNTIDKAIALTKKAGLDYLYHPGPFENWGHFDLKKNEFPENWKSMKFCVDRAAAAGIKVGVHTLSNFITTNDPYVTPVPDKRLAKVGSSILTTVVAEDDINIKIEDPTYFDQMENNNLHAVVVGEEIIRYEMVSKAAPWTLLNCQRGAFGTVASKHSAGDEISKLADHAYKTFLGNISLSEEMAGTLADLFNEVGLKQISFDGLEGNYSSGMGAYGELLFVDTWYNKLKPVIKNDYIMDASRSGHYFWHMFTRMNWGEPWYAGFRESQTTYRLLNQDYFRRNYIPSMLGWFSMREGTGLEDIEWMLARSAGFEAGYALVTSADIADKNGLGEEILDKIKQWERARKADVFSPEQKKSMENIENEFSLEALSDDSWNLVPYSVWRFEHKAMIVQPGQPVWSTFTFKNGHKAQPLQFILSSVNAIASHIAVEIDDFKKNELNISLAPGQYLKYTGGNEAVLYDKTWHKIKSIAMDPQQWNVGKGDIKIKVDCQFSDEGDAALKLELKTSGPPEKVTVK
ncbi:hypothetical protein K8352_08200 [Flavobacteriaceae bacterium F89]|uniref:Uncharacterized protein n=1 Tax=Cerina litoralis TaxID=2874477 RepID=A0AAE3JP82_9FLAO|nr:hypothetical protein [Cerina litoralis]MCG2460726.1 hypothetical protein [Cerina litoralis]